MSSTERSQKEAAHLVYSQGSVTEPRRSFVGHDDAIRSYARKQDEEHEVLWKMLQEARMETEVLRQQDDYLQSELKN